MTNVFGQFSYMMTSDDCVKCETICNVVFLIENINACYNSMKIENSVRELSQKMNDLNAMTWPSTTVLTDN